MNKVILLGRLTQEPEIKYTQNGTCVTNITIAVNRPYQKNKEQEADFVKVVFWGKPAETVGNNFSKGERILVTGRLQIRSYTAQDGGKRWVTEVIGTEFPEFIEKKERKNADNVRSQADSFGTQVFEEEEVLF